LLLLPAEFNEKAARPLSTFPVDKFVDFLGAAGCMPQEWSAKSAAIKNSSAFSGRKTAPYGIESAFAKRARVGL
jgi:hypothetical protein